MGSDATARWTGRGVAALLCVLAACLVWMLAPLTARAADAASDAGVIVDDTVVDAAQKHYFTYAGATDQNGATGWAADTKTTIQGDSNAQTQHWTWNSSYDKIKDLTYTFTFEGTGVELMGVRFANDAAIYELDGTAVTASTAASVNNTPVSLYKVTGLSKGKHTVKVKPGANAKGLQVCYARVFGADADAEQPAAKIKVAAVGDSLTEGYLSTAGNKGDDAYPAWLQRLLGDEYQVQNFGKTSYTLMRGTNKSYWDTTEFTNSKNFEPNIVIIMLGTNDSKDSYWNKDKYLTDAKALVAEYKNLPSKPKVYFALSPHSFAEKPATAGDISADTIDKRLHPAQEELLQDTDFMAQIEDEIDLYDATANRSGLYHADGVHFTDTGYKWIAEQMQKAIVGDANALQAEVISHKKTTGASNKFTFAENAWEAGSDEHTWSKAPSSTLTAENIWYQVDFTGSRIDVYAGKNKPMGKVKYYIDGVEKGTYDLYNNGNINSTFIASFDGLSDGPHTFKAVAAGEKNTSATNYLIDCAKVIVYHKPYAVTGLDVAPTALSLKEGQEQKLTVTPQPDYARVDDLAFTSSNKDVATVTPDGTVTAEGKGTATITLKSKDYKAAGTVNVTVAEAKPQIAGGISDTDTQHKQTDYDKVKAITKTTATLSAWKNDAATSEISVASVDSKLKNLQVEVSDLTGPDGAKIAKSNVTATFIASTKAYNGAFLGYGDPSRAVPAETTTNRSESNDILSTTDPVTVGFNQVKNIWLEFAVPKTAAAGTYTATVKVTADGLETPLTCTYTLKVADAVLADASDFKNQFSVEFWQYPYTSAEYYGVDAFSAEHLKILKENLKLYKKVGGDAITATMVEDAWNGQTYSKNAVHYPSMIKWTKGADGKFTYDYKDFDAWVSLCKEMGLGDRVVLYGMAAWGGKFTYWENGQLKYENMNPGSARYEEVWSDFLSKLTDHLMDKGWYDSVYIGFDERNFTSAALDVIDKVKNLQGKSLKTAGCMDSINDNAKYQLALRLTDLSVGDFAAVNNKSFFDSLLKARNAAGLKTTLYSCTEHQPGNFSLSAPVESYWSAINAGKETSGFLRWAYDAWVADPLHDATHNAFEPGDPFLIYPAVDAATVAKGGNTDYAAKSSVRLERLAEGVRDVNKIKQMVSEVPALQTDVDAAYKVITQVATKNRDRYMTAEQVASLASQMTAFKAKLDEITDKYINAKKTGVTEVESVAIEGAAKQDVQVGGTLALTAKVLPENLLNPTVSWTSSNPKVATVDANGQVTGVKVGTVTVTATSKADAKKSASVQITVKPMVVAQGLHYYSFDDGTAKDAWGTRNGTVSGAHASFADGQSSKALKVTGDDAVTLTGDSGLTDTSDWTVSYWVKSDKDLTDRSSVMMDSAKDFSFDLKMAANQSSGFHVNKTAGGILTFGYTFKKDTWYHVTWTQSKTGSGLVMYVNGVKVKDNAWTKTNTTKAPVDIIGGTGFTGLIDEVKIYNRVLSEGEIKADMLLPGLNLSETSATVYVGETYEILANLVTSAPDATVTYESSDPAVASVDADGVVTGHKRGTAKITVSGGGYTETVTVSVEKKVPVGNKLPQYKLDQSHVTDVHKSLDQSNQYFGQPDMIRTKTGRLITSFPQGHGKGPLIMKISDDNGATWVQKDDIPSSWADSQETPTMYTLDLGNGKERLLLITACPGRWGDKSTGWNTSYSDDNGKTWTKYEHWYSTLKDGTKNECIVGMASLVQLKDEDGNYIQKWMGVYHNYDYVNFRTYLTVDPDGTMHWSDPEPYLSEYRDIEKTYQMCEIGMFRSPDGKRIVGLARSQSHNNPATLIYSDDEGKTWSKPMDLPGSLAGERHKVAYDPISGRLLITFREIKYDLNGDGKFGGANSNDWICGDWVAWVGTYDQLMNQENGEYQIVLAEDWANNQRSGDTGYAGVVVLDDGTFIMDSYGHWDKDFSQSWTGGVTTDRCYIKQAKFKLGEVEEANGLVKKDALKQTIEENDDLTSNGYTQASWEAYTEALAAARAGIDDSTLQQVQVDELTDRLKRARAALQLGEVDATATIEYLGSSLRKSDDVSEKVAGLRFGYRFTLPKGAEPVWGESGWSYGVGNLAGGSLSIKNVRENGTAEDGGKRYIANIVFTAIPKSQYRTGLSAQVKLTYNLGGKKYTVTRDGVETNSVADTAQRIVDSPRTDADAVADRQFAQKILDVLATDPKQ